VSDDTYDLDSISIMEIKVDLSEVETVSKIILSLQRIMTCPLTPDDADILVLGET
jgi:hypothetical protein